MSVDDRWQKVRQARDRLIIWGASDQCRVNYPILQQLGCRIEGLIDDTPGKDSPFDGVPIYAGEQGLDMLLRVLGVDVGMLGFVVAIGNPFGNVRTRLHSFLCQRGLVPISFADPTALICKTAIHGKGLQVMPGAIVHNDVRIGEQCIINTRALVEHDCVLENGVEVGPGAVLCGRVRVGENSWIGAGATVRPRVTVGPNTIIGAGAVVVTDIPGNSIAVGVPARVTRRN